MYYAEQIHLKVHQDLTFGVIFYVSFVLVCSVSGAESLESMMMRFILSRKNIFRAIIQRSRKLVHLFLQLSLNEFS